jgi:hypothetical protein
MMNKLLLTLLAIGFMATACYATDGTVTVKQNGNYTVGAPIMTKPIFITFPR